MLRQRSRPYLFSNSVAPAIIGASLEMFKILKESDALHTKLMDNVNYFRDRMLAAGFDIKPTQSAICAVMLYDAKTVSGFCRQDAERGHICNRFLLSGCSERTGTYPCPVVCRA